MSALYTGKLSGLTAGSVAVATLDVTLDSDGFIRWTDANGDKHQLCIAGEIGNLLTTVFTGVNGITHTLFK